MYNPQRYKVTDANESFDLMDRNPFATVITVIDGKPFVSHLPLTPKRVGDKFELIGHLARANPHWKSFSGTQATVIFHGPHTYITPKWYAENDVPTWNYSTVHVNGRIELIESHDGIVECLTLDRKFDGLWCSFTAAYFTNFDEVFGRWVKYLSDNAWVCISEVDDLLGHEPLSLNSRQVVESFYDEALQAKRYDFRMGRKIEAIVKSHGFDVTTAYLTDKELSFNGAAHESVLQAWSNRFNRMGGLKSFLREDFNAFREEFLEGLTSRNHRSLCKVVCITGTRPYLHRKML